MPSPAAAAACGLQLLLAMALTQKPLAAAATDGPSASPGSGPNAVDCAFRELAVRVASRNLGDGNHAKLLVVARGLNASACPGGAGWASRHARAPARAPAPAPAPAPTEGAAQGGADVYVSPTGSDANPGTITAPLQTLRAAQLKVRGLLRAQGGAAAGPVSVLLRAGTYHEGLVLGPEDSGSSPQKHVTWGGYAGETAVISGGDVVSCDWSQAAATPAPGPASDPAVGAAVGAAPVYTCTLPAGTREFTSLFLDGQRLQRARWPNGDPSIPCNGPDTCAQAGYTQVSPPPPQPPPPHTHTHTHTHTHKHTHTVTLCAHAREHECGCGRGRGRGRGRGGDIMGAVGGCVCEKAGPPPAARQAERCGGVGGWPQPTPPSEHPPTRPPLCFALFPPSGWASGWHLGGVHAGRAAGGRRGRGGAQRRDGRRAVPGHRGSVPHLRLPRCALLCHARGWCYPSMHPPCPCKPARHQFTHTHTQAKRERERARAFKEREGERGRERASARRGEGERNRKADLYIERDTERQTEGCVCCAVRVLCG